MMREEFSKSQSVLNKSGVTLIELLVVLVISGILIGGTYRVFIGQTKAYTVQDQVAEVQQNVRSAMEIVVRDLLMAGFQTSTFDSPLITLSPVGSPLSGSSITVNYEYLGGALPTTYTVTYTLAGRSLTRTLTQTPAVGPSVTDTILENVDALTFTYGIDQNGDGVMDDINGDGVIDDRDFVIAANVGTAKVMAVRVALTAQPTPVNPDVKAVVSPRTLGSAVTLRNVSFRKSQAY
ncbi:MAG: prepilin-type N-terminal cleavage/methylation domain-containing protein [Syntrophales bacterium]